MIMSVRHDLAYFRIQEVKHHHDLGLLMLDFPSNNLVLFLLESLPQDGCTICELQQAD
jgi:hypothetical protein